MTREELLTTPNLVFGFSTLALGVIASQVAIPHWVLWPVLAWLLFWLLSLIALANDRYRARLKGLLSDEQFKHAYVALTLPPFRWLWRRLARPAGRSAGFRRSLAAALTARLLDRAMLIAVFYPILGMTVIWLVSGTEGRIGGVTLFSSTEAWEVWPERVAALPVFVLLFAAFIGRRLASASRPGFWRSAAFSLSKGALPLAILASILPALAGANEVVFVLLHLVFIALVIAIAPVLTGTEALAIAFIIALAPSIRSASALAGPFAFAMVVALATALACSRLAERGRQGTANALVIGACVVALVVLPLFLPWSDVPGEARSFFVFLAVLPLANAAVDAVSYALTLALLRLGLKRWNPVLCGVLDVIGAAFLFLALGIALTAIVTLLNRLAGVPLVDLGALFADLREFDGADLWLYLMLFSTALPTAVHLMLATVGLQSVIPHWVRRPVLRLIDASSDPFAASFAPALAGLILVLPVLGAAAVVWGHIAWGRDFIIAAIGVYGDVLLRIAAHSIGAF